MTFRKVCVILLFVEEPQNDNRREKEIELVNRCVAGEEVAWREFVGRFTPLAAKGIRRVMSLPGEGGSQEIDHLVSAVFEKLLEEDKRALREFEWGCSLSTWLYLISLRTARNHLRERVRERGRLLRHGESLRHAVPAESPLDALDRRERSEWIRRGLAKLPPEERRLLLDLFLHDRSYTELAREKSLPLTTLFSRVSAAKQRLLGFLKKNRFLCL